MKFEELFDIQTSWDYLKTTSLPVFVYGMGDGCLKLMREFDKRGIAVCGIFASDEFVRGHSFEGHLVHKLSEIETVLGCGNFVITLAFAAGYQKLIKQIDLIEQRNILVVPDTDVIGTGAFTDLILMENEQDIRKVYNALADDFSKNVYLNVLAFKLSGKLEYLRRCTTLPEEAYANILKLQQNEVYVDLGAFNGDTIAEFINNGGKNYEAIYAFEPNIRNFRKLSASVKDMRNVTAIHAAAWCEDTLLVFNTGGGRQSQVSKKGIETSARSVDSVLGGHRASYIKFDVEGSEAEAINGCSETIMKYSPKLCVALYHRAEDMFRIPLQVLSINPNYKLYIRHFPYYPAWETNLFAVNE